MLLRVTIPPRPAVDGESCCVDPDCQWNEETTGSLLELHATQFAEKLRALLERELRNAEHSEEGDKTAQVSRTPRFLNQATLTLWLDQQKESGKAIVELAAFPCVAEYPDHWNDLIFMQPQGLSHGRWSTYLASALCPLCGISYGAGDVSEIEHDLFFYGEYVLTCPRHHHLLVLGSVGYQLGG